MQEKMYRIFVSSTFTDLRDERDTIIKSILQLGHFPICMENFVASQYHQMDFIKEQLDTADMFIIIIGKRYGSCPDGDTCSFTEHEYEYAKQIGLPILALISSDKYNPDKNLIAETTEKKQGLSKFLEKLQKERLSAFWDSAADLSSKANASIEKLIRKDVEGWIRETKYQRIKRRELTDKINNLQRTIYSIDFLSNNFTSDCLLDKCNELFSIYHQLKEIGFAPRDRVQFKKIDFLFYYMKSKTETYNLNPIVIYRYAQFLHDFYEIDKAKEVVSIYFSRTTNNIERANALNFLGLLYWETKNFSSAIEQLNKAKNSLMHFFNTSETRLSQTIVSHNNKQESEKALKILCEIYNVLGLCSDNKNEIKQAIDFYDMAVKVVEKLNTLTTGNYNYKYQLYLFNMASAYYKNKQYTKAKDIVLKVIHILENDLPNNLQNIKRKARTYQLYGDILFHDSKGKAKPEYYKAADLYKEVIKQKDWRVQVFLNDYKKDIAWCCHKLSEVYYQLNQYDRAVTALKKAIDYREELLLSSIGQEHFEYLLDLAESEYKISEILFFQYNKDSKRHKIQLDESYHFADSAFYYFEQLFDSNHEIYCERYKAITLFNIKLCTELKYMEKVNYYEDKLVLAA